MEQGETWSALFARAAERDAPAVVGDSGTWSARELLEYTGAAAGWLDAIGARPGQPIAALLAARPQSISLALAALATHRPLAPLGPRLTLRELHACLEPLGTSVLVADPEVADLAAEAARSVGIRAEIVPMFTRSGRALRLAADASEPAAILHTSGTSGTPRAVAYRQDRLATRTRVNGRLLALGPGCVYATASPFHHIAGLGALFVALGSGAAVFPLPRYDSDTWNVLVARGVTHGMLVPTLIEDLLARGRIESGSLRVLQYGASPIRPETLQRLLDSLPGIEVVQIYGQTEGSPITCLTPDDHRRAAAGAAHLLGSAGRPAPGVELCIHAPDAEGVGEVRARAAHFFRPAGDGWLHTGDLGRVDAEGFLYLAGRESDLIIRGGENVHPQEVEQVLEAHPGVREAAVVGVPDLRLGERIRACIVARDPGAPPDTELLRRYARGRLAGFKIPAEWRFVDSLPRNAAGKLLRSRLRGVTPS